MKKILKTMLILALIAVMLLAFSGCALGERIDALGDAYPDVQISGQTAAQIVSDFLDAALRLVLLAVTILFTKIVAPFLLHTVLPYFKDKALFQTIRIFVRAAEKKGETGAIDKSKKMFYVLGWLENLGIHPTEKEKQMIEAAVEELDKMGSQAVDILFGDAENVPQPTPAIGPEAPDPDDQTDD